MMSTSDNCKDGASKSKSDGLCVVNNKLENMSIIAAVSICANCGKEGDDINNVCAKCKQVRYCNAVCKKVHKKKHKKQCEEHIRLATEKLDEELRIAAELHDTELFKQPPPPTDEDCPICFLRLPSLPSGSTYYACCGKMICSGCVHAPVYDNQGNKVDEKKCPFCRAPDPKSDEEIVERYKLRVEINDAYATYDLGCCYRDGDDGYPQDYTKALELYHRAAELGYTEAYCNIGNAYLHGRGVEVDKKKANHFYELGAINGDVIARYNLGHDEWRAGDMDRALKHYTMAARGGYADSLIMIQNMHKDGYATKDDYTKALQLYQAYLGEIKSKQRDEAAAAHEEYRYY